MKLLILGLLVLTTKALSQFDLGLKPDVTFGDHNDRFDLTSLMQDQNTYLDRSEEFRRYGRRKQTAYDGERQNAYNGRRQKVYDVRRQQDYLDISEEIRRQDERRQNADGSEEFQRYQGETETYENGPPVLIIRRNTDKFRPYINVETVPDFQENLKLQENRRFQKLVAYLHGVGRGRRNKDTVVAVPDPENEILMHHAVPIDMTIDGFLKDPVFT